jgi:hypothetical protein
LTEAKSNASVSFRKGLIIFAAAALICAILLAGEFVFSAFRVSDVIIIFYIDMLLWIVATISILGAVADAMRARGQRIEGQKASSPLAAWSLLALDLVNFALVMVFIFTPRSLT